MTAQLTPVPFYRDFDNQGHPLAFGSVYTYIAGTSTLTATYVDSTQTTPNTNPIILNARGEAQIWLVPGNTYKFAVFDQYGNQIRIVDQIYSIQGLNALTQAIIGSLLNPQTPAEIAAGVTPVNYAYPALNVFRYGATGNGTTDDTTALLAAISVAAVSGGKIILPAGTYKHSQNLVIGDHSNIYLVGAGAGLTQLQPTNAVTTVLSFGVSSCINQGISGIELNCENSTNCVGININTGEYQTFKDIVINQAGVAIQINGGVIQYFTNLQIIHTTTYGILIEGGNDQYFNNVVISNSGFTQCLAGIVIYQSGGVWLSNMDVISTGYGIVIEPANGQTVDWLFAVNVAFDTCTNSGIALVPTGTGAVNGCDFTACWSSSHSAYGVYLAGTGTINGTRFNGLRCQNNQQHGIVLNSGSAITNTSLDSCDVTGNSQASSGTYDGLYVGANIGSFNIRGGRYGQEDGYLSTQQYGIQIASGTSNNYSIVGANVQNNVTGGINDGGSGATKTIVANPGYNPFGAGSISPSGSPYTYSNDYGAPIAVAITGGTVSSVTVNGYQVASATNTTVVLPHGISMVVTYSSAPTMNYYGIA